MPGILQPAGAWTPAACPALAPAARAPLLAPDGSGCHAVVAYYGGDGPAALADVRAQVPRECRVLVYDKTDEGACGFMPMDGIDSCTPLPNRGAEQHTYAKHMSTHYDDLPTWLLLLSSPLARHARGRSLQLMLNATVLAAATPGPSSGLHGWGFSCISDSGCEFHADFERLDTSADGALDAAEIQQSGNEMLATGRSAADADGDGRLDLAECARARVLRVARPPANLATHMDRGFCAGRARALHAAS